MHGRMGDLVRLGTSGVAFAAVYLAGVYAMRIGELKELADFALQKLRKRA
jgi:hypothetical protein